MPTPFENDVSRTPEARVIFDGWSNGAQNEVRAAVTPFDDVAELVVCEEKGTQADSCMGLKPSFFRKLEVHYWCSFMKAAPQTAA